ncbi:hypothetical protein [Ascidiimonas sp. W6]|uniref:hypothetical protein n=1 Tax=Ascidiimonas meishanensis TaxID=3128903 RepID=UPI0030EDB8DA
MRNSKEQAQKIILIVLFVAIGTLVFVTYLNYQESGKKASFLSNEKDMIIQDLRQMQESFDEMYETKGVVLDEIKTNRRRIAGLLDSINLMEVDYKLLQHYHRQLAILRKENKRYREMIDSISYQNRLLELEIDSTRLKIRELSNYSESLKDTNSILSSDRDSLLTISTKLANKISSGSIVTIYKLTGKAFKFRSKDRMLETSRASKADRLRVCFTVLPNKLLKDIKQEIYLQIIDPKNNVLGERKMVRFNDEVLSYSKILTLDVADKPIDFCDFIIAPKEKTVPGLYNVNLFFEEKLLANSTFELK